MPIATLPLIDAPGTVDAALLENSLRQRITGEVRFDRLSRAIYSTDASVYQIIPLGVILPANRSDVLAALATAREFCVPITARGGGTSQAGQAIGAGLLLDCSKYFNRILEIDVQQRWVRVEPGCVLDELNEQLKPFGLHFPIDISTANRATIGGMIANNSSGTRSIIYGKTGDHVLELTVALSDGSVIEARPMEPNEVHAKCSQATLEGRCYRTLTRLVNQHAAEIDRRFPRILRRVGGYNLEAFLPASVQSNGFRLANLLVGSEGTLALTLEAKLSLSPLPKAKAVLVVQFSHLLEALAATPLILEHHPSAVEVIDKYVLDSTRINPEAARLRSFLKGDPEAILIIEFYGETAAELPDRLHKLEADLQAAGLGESTFEATSAADQSRIWKLRKLALGLSMAEKGDAKAISFVEDTAVAPEKLRDFIAEFLDIIHRHQTKAGVYAHASVGCLHVRPVVNLKTESGLSQFEGIANDVADLVLKYGGALSGEHGDGLVRGPFQEKMYGSQIYQVFREIKRTFDPLNLLNPGKIVDCPPRTVNLRFGPRYVTPDVPTTFDFSADGGIVRAAELCAGVGECRKKREGTMCPSYQATGEELHSTRGRANALRLALTGQLGFTGLTDQRLQTAFDLCLECKACKSECPTNVDMARLKAEFLHQWHQDFGVPLRHKLFGHVAKLARLGVRWSGLANKMLAHPVTRWLNEKLLGITGRRRLPLFAEQSLFQLVRKNHHESQAGKPARVVFFVDTFANYFDVETGLAVLETLRALDDFILFAWAGETGSDDGCHSFGLQCCGRPLISNGLLDEAVECARNNVKRLYPYAAEGIPIVAAEPSCLLTMKDDYPALLRGDLRRRAERVAHLCQTFEEYVERRFAELPMSFRPWPRRIVVHGHCHQRSLVGMEPTLQLLRRMPNADVRDSNAGCCGMAGSFGYEAEHYELSRDVGEQRLFPLLRKESSEATVAAAGFSCRVQISHFTGVAAVHPAQIVAEALIRSSAGW